MTGCLELAVVAEVNSHHFWNSVASGNSAPGLLLNGNEIFDDAPDVISDLNGDGVVGEMDFKLLRVASNIKKVKFFINGNLRSRARRGKSPGPTRPPACATGTRVDSLPIPGRHPSRSREGCPNQPRIGTQWSVQSILHTSSFPVGRLRDRFGKPARAKIPMIGGGKKERGQVHGTEQRVGQLAIDRGDVALLAYSHIADGIGTPIVNREPIRRL